MPLPKEIIKASTKSPQRLTFYSPPKSGKTTLLSMLKDNLILDFESGSDFVDALKIKIIGIYPPDKEDKDVKAFRLINNEQYLKEVLDELKEYEAANGGKHAYRYISVDTTTGLEDMLIPLAAKLYKATPMASKWEGTDVRTLPNGAGWLYWRQAFDNVISMIQARCERIILSGHLKEKMIELGGKEVVSKDIDLSGKLRQITCAKSDAVGYLYRDKKGVWLSFKTAEDIICGARPEHLRNKAILMSEIVDGQLIDHWNEVFID